MPFDTLPATEDDAGFLIVDLPDDENIGFLDDSSVAKYADQFDELFAGSVEP